MDEHGNEDGAYTVVTLKNALARRHVTVSHLFRLLDVDLSNTLTKKEFLDGLAITGDRIPDFSSSFSTLCCLRD